MIPGEYFHPDDEIELNSGKPCKLLSVSNKGDRPIQIGAHMHFFEVNRSLIFDREAAFGMRLNIPSGTCVRFEPGQTHEVEVVALGGIGVVYGFNRLTEGSIADASTREGSIKKMRTFCDGK
ncbi:MAG TPA: urease subunit beta [Trichormus sp.]